MSLELAGANTLLVLGHGRLGGGGGGAGDGGGLSDSHLSVPAHSRIAVVVLKPLVSSPAVRSACRCHMMSFVTVPGLGLLRCRGGGGLGDGSGLWDWFTLSSSSGIGILRSAM